MAAAGMKMPAVLFCCTHNRCRSRMAEAVARHLLPGWTFMSAGSAPAGGIDPGAEAALRESGLEASGPARRVQDLAARTAEHEGSPGPRTTRAGPRPFGI